MQSTEIWKDIPGYEGNYQVSSIGNVRSLDRWIDKLNHGKPSKQFCRGKVLKQDIDEDGYCRINIRFQQTDKRFGVHRLVAQAFIPNPDDLPTVNHKDGNKQNNCIDNLEWMTVADQNRHAINTGLRDGMMVAARKISKPKISKKVRCIETGQIFESCAEAERQLGLGSTAVFHSIKFNRPTRKGLSFEVF